MRREGSSLADGWLLARDLYDMKLDCELATVSACRTGQAYVEAGCALLGLQLDPAWRSGVVDNLRVLMAQGATLLDPALPDEADPAPVFRA